MGKKGVPEKWCNVTALLLIGEAAITHSSYCAHLSSRAKRVLTALYWVPALPRPLYGRTFTVSLFRSMGSRLFELLHRSPAAGYWDPRHCLAYMASSLVLGLRFRATVGDVINSSREDKELGDIAPSLPLGCSSAASSVQRCTGVGR